MIISPNLFGPLNSPVFTLVFSMFKTISIWTSEGKEFMVLASFEQSQCQGNCKIICIMLPVIHKSWAQNIREDIA